MAVDPRQMAAGGGTPPQDVPRIAPGAPPQGGPDPQAVMQALAAAIQQSVDESGFVDLQKLIQIWPQVAQQVGINIPFEAVLAMLDANPGILASLIEEFGLAGMIINGQKVTGEMLEQALSSGGAGGNPAAMAQGGGQM